MNKTLTALVLGAGILGAGCSNTQETGYVYDANQFSGKPSCIEKAAGAKGWEYVAWDGKKGYGRNPFSCEQLSSFPDKETILFPVFGIKDDKAVSGNMCCLGEDLKGNFWVEYCILLENNAEVQ